MDRSSSIAWRDPPSPPPRPTPSPPRSARHLSPTSLGRGRGRAWLPSSTPSGGEVPSEARRRGGKAKHQERKAVLEAKHPRPSTTPFLTLHQPCPSHSHGLFFDPPPGTGHG